MTIEIGQYNRLTATRRSRPGLYLSDGENEVLLPNRYATAIEIGAELEVFVYTDSDDRPVATTRKPHVRVGQFAFLEVLAVGQHGAFLDWGLEKDLFVPFAEQEGTMRVGASYVVAVCLDEVTQRVMATAKLTQFIDSDTSALTVGDAVELLVYRLTPLGAQVVVAQHYEGLLYGNDTFVELALGQSLNGHILRVREDGKLDITLKAPGNLGRSSDLDRLLQALEASGGHLALHDKSSPAQIASVLSMSKKAFKRAVGHLYRQRQVTLSADGIHLVKKERK